MAKTSFILYKRKKNTFDILSDENAGKLIKAIFQYQSDGSRPDDCLINSLLEDFVVDFTADDTKYEDICRKRSAAGNAGAAHRWKQSDKKETPPSAQDKHTPQRRFVPPTLEEVKQYCFERNNNVDPETFYNHYVMGDWYLNNGKKMKDWRAAIRLWERNEKRFSQPLRSPKKSIFDIAKNLQSCQTIESPKQTSLPM